MRPRKEKLVEFGLFNEDGEGERVLTFDDEDWSLKSH